MSHRQEAKKRKKKKEKKKEKKKKEKKKKKKEKKEKKKKNDCVYVSVALDHLPVPHHQLLLRLLVKR